MMIVYIYSVPKQVTSVKESMESKSCPIIRSIEVIGNRWALTVIRYLMDRPMRFNEFLQSPSRIDPKTL